MKFKPSVTDPNHYINQVIKHFSRQTDAVLDIHEAYAFLHLAAACMRLRWKFNPMADFSDRLNLYFLFLGESGDARKSTAMRLHAEILEDLFRRPVFFEGDIFTPQGLRDGLEERDGFPTIIHFDEMEDIFKAMATPGSNMGQLPMMLKQLYSKKSLTTKLSKVGKAIKDQEVAITDSFLCLMGNVTPTIGTAFEERYLTDGLVARMNIIQPSHTPKQMSAKDWTERYLTYNDEIITEQEARKRWLRDHIQSIANAIGYLDKTECLVEIPMEALLVIDEFEKEIDTLKRTLGDGDVGKPSYERVKTTTFKCAVLIAAGRLGGAEIQDNKGVTVSKQDAMDAVRFGRKLLKNAQAFVSLCSSTREQKDIDFVLKKCKALSPKHRNMMSAKVINRACKNKLTAGRVDQVLHDLLRSGDLTVVLDGGMDTYSVAGANVATAELVPPEDDDAEPKVAEVPN